MFTTVPTATSTVPVYSKPSTVCLMNERVNGKPAQSVTRHPVSGLTTWVFLFLEPNSTDKASISVSASFQIKATDSGQVPLSASVRLHIEWIPQPRPSSIPMAFDEPHYSFTVMETDPVNHMVGVISVEGRPGLFWFNISGEGPRRTGLSHPYRPALVLMV